MSKRLIILIGIIITTMYSLKTNNTEIENLKQWKAGKIVSPNAINEFGKENVFVSENITNDIFKRIYCKSYKAESTIPIEDLRYLKLLHYDIEGKIRIGEIICNKSIALDLIDIFKELYKEKYPIEKMLLIDEYNANDDASMKDNNSSSFNFRSISGGGKLSKHALGLAIDINPLYNPYVKIKPDGQLHIEPAEGEAYIDRSKEFNYKIDSTDLCYKLFIQHGFEWGGNWKTIKDYQHFEK